MRTILFFAIIALYLAANVYAALRVFQLLPSLPLKCLSLLSFLLGIVALVLPMLFRERLPLEFAATLYRFATAWIFIFMYLLMLLLVLDLFKVLNHFFPFVDKPKLKALLHNNGYTALVFVGLFSILFFFANRSYHHKDRVELSLQTDVIERPLRIVALSDLHLGFTIGRRELAQWVRLINAEQPDLILIAGDLLDNSVSAAFRYHLDEELRKLNAPLGVYACPGNHEYISGIEQSKRFFEQSNIKMLSDSVADLGGLVLVGRDDYSNRQRKSLSELMQTLPESSFTILLDHQPQLLDEAAAAAVDFQFSGHTHRGQLFPISLLTDRLFELSHGYLKKGKTQYYVSSGMGIWGGKFRIGTRSEYLVLDINK